MLEIVREHMRVVKNITYYKFMGLIFVVIN